MFLWRCTFPSSINFLNGWFVYMSEITYFVFLIKFPIWLWIGLLYVLSMILKIFPDIIYFQMHLCVSPCLCSGSTFHVHVAVENMHVHNALINFVICYFHSFSTLMIFWMPLPTSVCFFSPSASINDPIYSKLFTLFILGESHNSLSMFVVSSFNDLEIKEAHNKKKCHG